jgi:D-serine dehydratase
VILESALENNLTVMATYCSDAGVSLAPHAKTTMSPQIIDRQLSHGAWGVTAATVYQVGVFADFGVTRILLANQVTDTAGLRALADIIATHQTLEVILIVDAVEGVGLLDHAFAGAGLDRPVSVLVEFGVPGRRTGARTVDALLAVAQAVHTSKHLALAGVEGYEGVLAGAPSPIDAIDAYLTSAVGALEGLMLAGLIETDRPIFTAGGSAYFDRVVAAASSTIPAVRVVLRSGCYVVHDHGKYRDVSPLDGRSDTHPTLFPALEVWASVVSTPEPGLVVVNAGRRDLSYDDRMPSAVKVLRRGSANVVAIGPWQASGMNDQHTMYRVDAGEGIGIGDLVGIGISHPCTTFDKWKTIMVVDDEYRVIDVVETYF